MIISKRKMEIERLKLEDEENMEAYKLQQEQAETNEELRQCLEEGKSCSYGICSECPLSVYENGGK